MYYVNIIKNNKGVGLGISGKLHSLKSKEALRERSRAQPGKADAKKTGDGRTHQKFLSVKPSIKMSHDIQQNAYKKNILLTFTSRNCCLCIKHSNMALMKELR